MGGATGGTGSSGTSGSSGATGATGAGAGHHAEHAPWLNLTLGNSASVTDEDVFPACFPDLNGQVFLRGQVQLYPVPAVGGAVLATLPLDEEGKCACTPESNAVFATTTAISYPEGVEFPNVTDVCIVRLKIDNTLPEDVNLDYVVNLLDMMTVLTSPYFNIVVDDPVSKCPADLGCGRVDVNGDGLVNQLDSISITPTSFVMPTNVSCGGIRATHFSCGSTRSNPLNGAFGVSLDTVSYFSDDGLMATGMQMQEATRLRRSARSDPSLMDQVLSEFDRQMEENRRQDEQILSQDKQILRQDELIRNLEKKLEGETKERRKNEEAIFHRLARSFVGDSHHLVKDVSISVAVVLICAAVALMLHKRM